MWTLIRDISREFWLVFYAYNYTKNVDYIPDAVSVAVYKFLFFFSFFLSLRIKRHWFLCTSRSLIVRIYKLPVRGKGKSESVYRRKRVFKIEWPRDFVVFPYSVKVAYVIGIVTRYYMEVMPASCSSLLVGVSQMWFGLCRYYSKI